MTTTVKRLKLNVRREDAIETAARCMAERAGDLEAYVNGLGYAREWRDDAEAVIDALSDGKDTE